MGSNRLYCPTDWIFFTPACLSLRNLEMSLKFFTPTVWLYLPHTCSFQDVVLRCISAQHLARIIVLGTWPKWWLWTFKWFENHFNKTAESVDLQGFWDFGWGRLSFVEKPGASIRDLNNHHQCKRLRCKSCDNIRGTTKCWFCCRLCFHPQSLELCIYFRPTNHLCYLLPCVLFCVCPAASYGAYPVCKGCSVCSRDNGCVNCQPKLFLFLRRERMRQYGECLHDCPSGYYGMRSPDLNMCSSKSSRF